jgi:hypothetical protein
MVKNSIVNCLKISTKLTITGNKYTGVRELMKSGLGEILGFSPPVVGISVCTGNCLVDFSRLKGDLEETYSQL